jgi:hypothetical protein
MRQNVSNLKCTDNDCALESVRLLISGAGARALRDRRAFVDSRRRRGRQMSTRWLLAPTSRELAAAAATASDRLLTRHATDGHRPPLDITSRRSTCPRRRDENIARSEHSSCSVISTLVRSDSGRHRRARPRQSVRIGWRNQESAESDRYAPVAPLIAPPGGFCSVVRRAC